MTSCLLRAPLLVSLWDDFVNTFNLSFNFTRRFAMMWLVFINVSTAVIFVLNPPCVGPPLVFTSLLIVVSVIKSP